MFAYLLRATEMRTVNLPAKTQGHFPVGSTLPHGGTEVLLTIAAHDGHWEVHVDPDIINNAANINGTILSPGKRIEIQRTTGEWMLLYCTSADPSLAQFQYYVAEDGVSIKIGSGQDCEIQYCNDLIGEYAMSIYVKNNRFYVDSYTSSLPHQLYCGYVDGLMVGHQIVVGVGSVLCILGLKILFGPGLIAVNMVGTAVNVHLPLYHMPQMKILTENQRLSLVHSDETLFSSAPRAYHREQRQEITVERPPEAPKTEDLPWIVMIGPSLTMSMGSLFSSVMTIQNLLNSGSPITSALPSLMMSLTMVAGMTLWPTLSRRLRKKRQDEQNALMENDYMNYLQWLVAEINRLAQQQINFANENNPSLEECISTIFHMHPSLWERSEKHEDFLDVMIGRGSLPLNVEFKYPERSYSTQITEAARAMYSIMEKDYTVQNVPITLSFKDSGAVGIVGQRRNVQDFIRALTIELTTLHNYQDLRLVFIFDKAEQAVWEFSKWVPHIWDHQVGFRCLASTPEEMKQLNDYLAARAQKRSNDQSSKIHYIIISANKELAERSDIITKLYHPDFCDNMTVLALYDHKKYLPKDCRYVVELQDSQRAAILDYNDTSGNIQYCSNYVSCVDDPGPLFIKMSNIHLGGVAQHIGLPTNYTMVEMCKVGRMEQIDLLDKWKNASPVDTLQAQIGIDSNGYPIYLDVHEKAHGPHGLIAGMTGSGKSEFIISYIASMAMQYSPEDVAFVLIDFKGGGMADVFRDLPHTAGLITNLDGNELKRSFLAIENELKKRQRLFKEISEQKKISNIDIYKYQNLRRSDPTLAPLPHLILISDEFAELKQQHRDFMEQLVRIARIGRSLGVHLILATQKPDGVVDDQIKSNIRFRVCLKVQDKNDSKTMIGKPDAADIINAGRFYLLVGNDEIFEYGQSPWSGATYIPSDSLIRNVGTQVTVLNRQGQPILQESVKHQRKADASTPEKQIDALVGYIGAVARNADMAAEKLWLHPLEGPENNVSDVAAPDDIAQPYVLNPVVGIYDDLENQKHLPLTVPFTKGGNTLLYCTSGSGELEFINAMLIDLLTNHPKEELNLYLIDYAAGSLSAFERAPHVKRFANATGIGDASKIMDEVMDILNERKHTLKEFGGDFQNYIHSSGSSIPNILLVIHNYQNLSEEYMDIRTVISSLARQGMQYGIYVFMTGTTGSSIPYAMQPLFHNIYTMQQNNEDQYREILGKTGGIIPANYKGRGLTRINGTVCEFQTTIVFPETDNSFQDIRNFCESLRDGSEEDTQVDMKTVSYRWSDIISRGYPIAPDQLPIGLKKGTTDAANISIYDEVSTLVIYDGQAISNVRGLLKLLRVSGVPLNYMGTDNARMHLGGWDAIRPTLFAQEISGLWQEMLRRANLGKEALAQNMPVPDFPHLVYIIDPVSTVMEWLDDESRKKLIAMISGLSPAYHIHFILLDQVDHVGALLSTTFLKQAVPFRQGLLLTDSPMADILFAPTPESNVGTGHRLFAAGSPMDIQTLELEDML